MGSNGPGKERPVPGGRLRPAKTPARRPRTPHPTTLSRDDLEALLEPIAVDALQGGLADRDTAGRVRTALRAELIRRGLDKARIQVEVQGTTLHVAILQPGEGPRVERVAIELNSP
ncbi:MAG: hypothetical protein EA397_15670 [Deltaproteobacteria bacterium]|nr:MAG: hypothetical protein EA397_15670 [Deltaproteobacteria bacterium]